VESKKIGQRIKFSRDSSSIDISISQRVKPWQEALIFAWLAVWVICGFFFLSTYFISEDQQQKIFIIIFMGFWTFFLFRAIKILLWRLIGSEELSIKKGELLYQKSYSGLGRAKSYSIDSIKDLGLIKYTDKSFKKSFEGYFWSTGAETIGFSSERKHLMLGSQLKEKDAKLLLNLITDGVKRFKN